MRVRFLRMVGRSIAKLRTPVSELASVTDANIELVERLEVSGKVFQSWQEAAEETIEVSSPASTRRRFGRSIDDRTTGRLEQASQTVSGKRDARHRTPAGTIHYQDTGGHGPTVVFLHGLMMDHTLWRKVVPAIEGDYRCVLPTLPLGGHRPPMNPTQTWASRPW